ncbi:MAG: lytic transglycosylase domain-containing protein [Rhizobiales bacterium]|nr:lytic transglycosylase domain-containing protein [Hyphomicrobiales bacterium]
MPRDQGLAFAAKTWSHCLMRLLMLRCGAWVALATAFAAPVAAMTDWQWERLNSGSSRLPVRGDHYAEDVCRIIAREAHRRVLPPNYLARLIWRESLFDAKAVSPKGAQGIAQFMPATAHQRGLADPFLPHEALPASASLLADLRSRFGNLGLAAAAYNAGPNAVAAWRAGTGGLSAETRDYVLFITGRAVDDWAAPDARHPLPELDANRNFDAACRKLAARRLDPSPAIANAAMKPWGAIVAGNRSASIALHSFAQLRQRYPKLFGAREPLVVKKASPGMGASRIAYVMIGADSRAEAEAFCAGLHAAGGDCLVERN